MKVKILKPIVEAGRRYNPGDIADFDIKRAKALGDCVKILEAPKGKKKSKNKAILETE